MIDPQTARRVIIAATVGLVLFLSASIYSYTRICCMFGSNRYFGWPFPYLSLHKAVETYEEAALVKTLPVPVLMRRGWKIDLDLDIEARGLFGSAVLNLIADLALAMAAGAFVERGLRRVLSRARKPEQQQPRP